MTPLSVLQEEQKGRQAGLAVNRVGSGPDSRSATHWLGSILGPCEPASSSLERG